jgi:carotenoid cleavage dioxygenase
MFATSLVPGEGTGTSTLDRWRIDLKSGKVGEQRLDDRLQEFPQYDHRLSGRRHRYGYSIGVEDPDVPRGSGPTFDTLFKHDLSGGNSTSRRFGPGHAAGEFTFVPNAPDAAEDDGVLVGYVYDAGADRSDLMFLDAGTLESVATVHLPVRVPAGFHGDWLPTT